MRVFNSQIITSAIMNTTIRSPAVGLANIYGFSVQAIYTGTPTGTLKLQASADPYKEASAVQPETPTNWSDISNSSVSLTAAGDILWNINGAFYNFVRVVYTDTSGGMSTAVLNVIINAKGA